MWKALRSIVGLPAVVVCLFLGVVLVLLSALSGGPLGVFFGGLLALLCFVVGFAMLFAVYIQRLNEDIDSERHELREELDKAMEDVDTEE